MYKHNSDSLNSVFLLVIQMRLQFYSYVFRISEGCNLVYLICIF